MGSLWVSQVGRESPKRVRVNFKYSPEYPGSLLSFSPNIAMDFFFFLLLQDTGKKLQRYTNQAVSPSSLLRPGLRSLYTGSPGALPKAGPRHGCSLFYELNNSRGGDTKF